MKAVAVIPARYASTRFPGKPLADRTGKFLIQHVCEQVGRCLAVERVVVATDDERIRSAVTSFGGEAVMTRPDHRTGTERVAEAVGQLQLTDDALVLNVQGDEPEIAPRSLERLVAFMAESGDVGIGTLAAPFDDAGPKEGAGSPLDPNVVKVVVDASGRALYFSRSLIPYPRETDGRVDRPSRWLLHLGVYAFRVGVLRRIAGGLPAGSLEETESLEQLRWLRHGFPIGVVMVEEASVGIDTPEDYEAFVRRVRGEGEKVGKR
ncbi:MAG: 3-deoxy-manno-octulosonate cytidylyltransferase [Planctomycetota bacterium]|nr:MAG: 3-deoxy-manno-octulosonate cytidylyltransferase [Planctomycetota bacterium]